MFDWNHLNYLAIVAGGILYMVYGTIYYSILLSDKNDSKNKDIIENQSKGPLKYIFSVIIAFINSYLIALLVQIIGLEHWFEGAIIGFVIGILITLVYLKNSMFGLMSRKALFISIGDHLIVFSLLGILHGLFL